MNLDFCYVHVSCIYNVMEVIVTSVCLNSHMVSVGLILVSTSCMQDSSQPVFVVADHIYLILLHLNGFTVIAIAFFDVCV